MEKGLQKVKLPALKGGVIKLLPLIGGGLKKLDDETILGYLEELAYSLNVQVRYEPLDQEDSSSSGGLCRLMGEDVLIINSRAGLKEKLAVFAQAVRQFDLDLVYLKPALREFLDEFD